MDSPRDGLDLAANLHALRPSPRPEFAAELDARAAAGFPRPSGGPRAALARTAEWLRDIPPHRIVAPAGGLALVAIATATVVIAVSDGEHDSSLALREDGERAVARSGSSPQTPSRLTAPAGAAPTLRSSGGSDSSGVQYSEAIPLSGAPQAQFRSLTRHRDVERAAQVVLQTDPADVRGDAAEVFAAVHDANGIVLRSSIRDGGAGQAGASFTLSIPTRNLSDALAAISAIADVRSRHESTLDITAPTVRVDRRLEESQTQIDGLLAELAQATTEEERASLEGELRTERRRASALDARLDRLHQRGDFSRVSVRIETGGLSTSAEGGAWGIGDGLDSAGRVLTVAAGVTIVGLAILTPLALLVLVAWLARRTWLRAGRERVLDA
jgi:Domain of unknown function (DUF4349)